MVIVDCQGVEEVQQVNKLTETQRNEDSQVEKRDRNCLLPPEPPPGLTRPDKSYTSQGRPLASHTATSQ